MISIGTRLLVNKFDDTFRFYSETLGLEVAWGKIGDVYASFKVNGKISLSIFEKKLMLDFLNTTDNSKCFSNNSVIVIDCNNVDKEYQILKAKGAIFENEPVDMPGWGMRCVHLLDPEGNIVELTSSLEPADWDDDLKAQAEEYK